MNGFAWGYGKQTDGRFLGEGRELDIWRAGLSRARKAQAEQSSEYSDC